MFEFKWQVPGPTPSEVTLRIHSRSGWLGRKVLTCGGRTVFRRGRFAGVEARLLAPGDGRSLDLRIVRVPNSADWRPALLDAGLELPETSGTAPPRIVTPPKWLVAPVGLTYLVMAIVVAMLPQTSTILDALYLRRDDRKAVLTVIDPNTPAEALAVDTAQVVPAVAGQPYVATLKPRGGTAPYTWSQIKDAWPRGWNLAAATGELSGTPPDAHDLMLRVKLSDAAGANVEWPIALVVRPAEPRGDEWPAITTLSLPAATLGQPYEFTVGGTGGQPSLSWKIIGKRRLPEGLELDPDSGRIHGVPKRVTAAGNGTSESSGGRDRVSPRQAEQFPVTIRLVDDYYASSRDIARWIVPFAVTAACLLGFLAMRRWSVCVYAALIVLQVVGAIVLALPSSTTALALQVILCLVGAAHLGKMR